MDGITPITYKGKTIISIEFNSCGGDTQKSITLLNNVYKVVTGYPKGTVLLLTDATDFRFNMDILNKFQNVQDSIMEYEKKAAVIGVKGLAKVAYNFIVGAKYKEKTKIFDTAQEAKEWLAS